MSSIHASSAAAAGKNEWDGVAPRFADGTVKVDPAILNRARVDLAKLAAERKDLSEREREVMKELVSQGHSKRAIRFMRTCETMDPDDREDFLAEIDTILTYLQFW